MAGEGLVPHYIPMLTYLATEQERHLTRGKRAERTKLDFRYPICRTAIGQASCLICARRRQLTFPFCCYSATVRIPVHTALKCSTEPVRYVTLPFRDRRGAAQRRSVSEIRLISPFLFVNRSPISGMVSMPARELSGTA